MGSCRCGRIDHEPETLERCVFLLLEFDIGLGLELARPLARRCPMLTAYITGIGALSGQTTPDDTLASMLIAEESIGDHRDHNIRLHLRAVVAYRERRRRAARSIWFEIVCRDPADMLALRFLATACFFAGDVEMMMAGCSWSAAAPNAVPSADRHHAWAMLAFALVEKGDLVGAETYAARALRREHHSIWAIHALCHVYLHQGRIIEGMEMLTGNDGSWRQHEDLACHIYWHWALFYLYLGQHDQALHLYDTEVYSRVHRSQGLPVDVSDAVSLLWRLELAGVDVSYRWAAVRDAILYPVPQFFTHPFTGSHYLILLGRVDNDTSGLLKLIMPELSPATPEEEVDLVAPKLYLGLNAYLMGSFNEAFTHHLFPIWPRLRCVGGSNVQRDLFTLITIDAALHGDDPALAIPLVSGNGLLNQRLSSALRLNVAAKCGSKTVSIDKGQ